MNPVVTEYKEVGSCTIDVQLTVKKWNHLWRVLQWDATYRLVKYVRTGCPNLSLNVSISPEQAKELIEKASLSPESGGFRSATTWRKQT